MKGLKTDVAKTIVMGQVDWHVEGMLRIGWKMLHTLRRSYLRVNGWQRT